MKSILVSSLLILFVALACSKGTESTPTGEGFALVNCTLIDGRGGSPVGDATIVIEGNRIIAAGRRMETEIPGDISVRNLMGATVLPGFINAHVHNAYSRYNLQAWAEEGVTTVRDLCGPSLFVMADSLSAQPECARLVAAGPMFSVPDGYPSVPWGSSCMLPVSSAEDARAKVAELIEDGADVIKMAVEAGASFGLRIPTLSAEEALAIVQTAHQHGRPVSAHVLVSSDLARALDAGADDIAHMVTDSTADNLVSRVVNDDVYWVPTLELWYHVGGGALNAAIHNLRKFVEAGGMVAVGTDYDGYDGDFQRGMPINELVWMRQAGMSNMQIIQAATRNAARVCNLDTAIGTIEAGKIADILVIDGDPLSDIREVTDVLMVIRDGVIIRDELSR